MKVSVATIPIQKMFTLLPMRNKDSHLITIYVYYHFTILPGFIINYHITVLINKISVLDITLKYILL